MPLRGNMNNETEAPEGAEPSRVCCAGCERRLTVAELDMAEVACDEYVCSPECGDDYTDAVLYEKQLRSERVYGVTR